jgi:hypothetical protein
MQGRPTRIATNGRGSYSGLNLGASLIALLLAAAVHATDLAGAIRAHVIRLHEPKIFVEGPLGTAPVTDGFRVRIRVDAGRPFHRGFTLRVYPVPTWLSVNEPVCIDRSLMPKSILDGRLSAIAVTPC